MEANIRAIGGVLSMAVVLVVFSADFASAQYPPRGTPVYDAKTELTLRGTVEAVKTVPGRIGRRSVQGTHVVLKTSNETMEVHVGPSAFLKEVEFEVGNGDTVEIVGSRVKVDGVDVLLAREIRKDDRSWTLRDATGRPRWMRARRRPAE